MFITGVNDTGEKLYFLSVVVQKKTKKPKIYRRCQKFITGVNDTTDKFFGGVSDTDDQRVLPILACLHLKMKKKQNFNL